MHSGNKIRFWEDVWIDGGLLKDMFPRLYDLELSKDCSVAEKIRHDDRHWSWLRGLRGRAEGQLQDMLLILQDFIPTLDGHDTWL